MGIAHDDRFGPFVTAGRTAGASTLGITSKGELQMPWEGRAGTQRQYYIRIHRSNGRVFKEYCGTGARGEEAAAADAARRSERQAWISAKHAEQRREAEGEAFFEKWSQHLDRLTRATLYVAGFYQHHGQWRRRYQHDSAHNEPG